MSLTLPALPAIPAPTVPLMDPQNPNVWNRIWYDYFKALDMVERAAAAAITAAAGTVVLTGALDLTPLQGLSIPPGSGTSQAFSVPGVLITDAIAWNVEPDGFSTTFTMQVYSVAADNITVFVANQADASRTFGSGPGQLNYAVIRAT